MRRAREWTQRDFSEIEVERSGVAKLLENLAVLANGAIDVLLPVHQSEPAVAREESVHAQSAKFMQAAPVY